MTVSERQAKPDRPREVPPPFRPWRPGRWAFLAGLGTLAVCGLLTSCGSKPETVGPAQAPSTNAAPAAAAPSPELAKLIGKWQRTDGDYVVEIKGVDPSGKVEAAYYNPSPIHVSRAAAWRDKGVSKLVIELQDVNYPGSTYTLTYDPASDQLKGDYFQAALQQHFDVYFTRVQP